LPVIEREEIPIVESLKSQEVEWPQTAAGQKFVPDRQILVNESRQEGCAMTKVQLEKLVLEHSRLGRDKMIRSHGRFREQAMIIEVCGKTHLIAFDQALHGSEMASFLSRYARSIDGVDAILIQADARCEPNLTHEETEQVADGKYMPGDDPANQEVFFTVGRSHQHVVACVMPYSRMAASRGDVIVFADPEPHICPEEPYTSMIPNIWERPN
jgi:hypothetical protein